MKENMKEKVKKETKVNNKKKDTTTKGWICLFILF